MQNAGRPKVLLSPSAIPCVSAGTAAMSLNNKLKSGRLSPAAQSVDKVCFHAKQQSRGSAHSKAFAAQTHKPVGLYPQKYLMRATGGVYLGFHTLRGRKFPYGNFRTSVFCEVKTQIVGKTIVFRQSQAAGSRLPLFERIF